MISKIKIELDLPLEESIAFLKTHIVKLRHKAPFGDEIEQTAIWTNLEDPNNFKFKLNSSGSIDPRLGKCSVKQSEIRSKSVLSILILPPDFILFFIGFVLVGVAYSIVQFGIHNYGTIGFLPSVIVPSFFVGMMILFWILLTRWNARKIKKDIIESIDFKRKEGES